MRPKFVVPVLFAACLASAVALAANDKVEATFESLSASGVTGEVALNPIAKGGTLIHASIRGLEPNTEYVSRLYNPDQACGVGTASELIVTFVSNPAGMATWNERVGQELASIRSISVELVSDNSVKACAGITQ
jgi:hypothetical protein